MVDQVQIDASADFVWIEKEKLELELLKANIELIQKVNRLVELLEKNHGNGNN